MNDFDNKVKEIIKFISKSDKKTIKNKLHDILEYNKFCPVVLGKGSFGKAYIPESKNIEINIDNKKVYLPIVVKEAITSEYKDATKPDLNIDIFGKNLYIIGNFNGITSEAIILMHIKQLCTKTVHLPLILGYGTCLENNKINKIITTRLGLDKEIEVDLTGKVYGDKKKITHKSYITTLEDLYNFIYYSKNKDGSVILPNGIKCDNISELYDYICISYLATFHLLTENKIYPDDMHNGNIFIRWLNDTSYYNNENIKDCKNIIYKVNNKYYKIKTFGFVIVFGDTGSFLLEAKKNVFILGFKNFDEEKEKMMRNAIKNNSAIIQDHDMIIPNEFIKSIAYKILNSEPYNLYPKWNRWGENITKNLSTPELLDFYYKKYGVDKYTKNKNTIFIKMGGSALLP
jgi:hypothetical protein